MRSGEVLSRGYHFEATTGQGTTGQATAQTTAGHGIIDQTTVVGQTITGRMTNIPAMGEGLLAAPSKGTIPKISSQAKSISLGPVPPPGAVDRSGHPSPHIYDHGYQTVTGYAVAEGRPVRERRLPCCGIGHGWFLFIIGFFIAGLPWYLGAVLYFCSRRMDYREKPGYIACIVAAILATLAIVFGVTKGADDW
uniref:60S ribosomal protein L18a-like protein n=1 Tax=Cannabis sativa TaxID=3483 RepID=A0A803NXT2_CANSA